MSEAEPGGIAALRVEWFAHLEGDVLPMAHLDTLITRCGVAATTSERHSIALDLIAGELAKKTILVGSVVGGLPAFIEPWNGPDSSILDRIKASYVDHYDYAHGWDLSIWFSLNDERRVFDPNDPDRC